MTIHQVIFSPGRQILLPALILLITAQTALLFAAIRDRRSLPLKLVLLLHFAFSTAAFWFCLYDISWDIKYPGGMKAPRGLLAAFGALPVSAGVIYELVTAAALCLAGWDTLRYRKSHVTPESVKQTMDLLPVGVACGRPDGTVLFRNLVMDHISVAKTGKLLTDLNAFRAAVGEGQVTVKDSVWQVSAGEVPGTPLLQLTATQITEQARLLADLQAKNRKLKDIHLRLDIYNRQAGRIIIAQEMLTARMAVHDELGHILLESRHYMNDPGTFNEALLLQALKNTNTCLLREYEQDDTARDPLADAIDTAEAIGVDVTIAGRIPSGEPCRSLLAAAVQECAANAVKHAGGDALQVQIRREENGVRFSLENNGTRPAGPIIESGGLLSLRALTESRGGRMVTESTPAFRLTVFLPDPADHAAF